MFCGETIAESRPDSEKKEKVAIVVLAQLSMSVFSFTFPDPARDFGVPVLNSGQSGFSRAGEVLQSLT